MTKKRVLSKPKPVASNENLEVLLTEVERELSVIQPKIEKLEKQLEKLQTLKTEKQRLIALRLSLKSILSSFSSEGDLSKAFIKPQESDVNIKLNKNMQNNLVRAVNTQKDSAAFEGVFIPEKAYQTVSSVLRRKNTINYELFKAIVLQGGRASTEDIKAYLIDNNICQPSSGETFESVALTDISSRVNYLIRKKLVRPVERGIFESCIGWEETYDNPVAFSIV